VHIAQKSRSDALIKVPTQSGPGTEHFNKVINIYYYSIDRSSSISLDYFFLPY